MVKKLNDVSIPVKIELKSLRKENGGYTYRLHVNGRYTGTQTSYSDSIKELKKRIIKAVDFSRIY